MISREHRELAHTLATFPVFAGCSSDDLTALARVGRVTTVPARWTLVHEGTPADACYVLLAGAAEVRIGGEQRATVGSGDVLGEMALLGRSLRSASVVTTSPLSALRVEYADLSELLERRPQLMSSLGAVFEQHRAADAGPNSRTQPAR